jgi:phosphatidate phosphatase
MRWRGSRLLRHFLQVVVLYAAIFISASRVSDYKHHWSDVLGGAVLGTVVAVMVVSEVGYFHYGGGRSDGVVWGIVVILWRW